MREGLGSGGNSHCETTKTLPGRKKGGARKKKVQGRVNLYYNKEKMLKTSTGKGREGEKTWERKITKLTGIFICQ